MGTDLLTILSFFIAPSAAPVSLQGRNASSTSIFITWGQVPASDRNGVILSYTVSYNEVSGDSEQTKIVNALKYQTILTGLNKYTNYTITVVAATSKGNGVVSAPIIFITDEDSEYNSSIHGTRLILRTCLACFVCVYWGLICSPSCHFNFIAPSAAPVSLQGHNTSSTSIFISWGQVPVSDRNGVILSYTVSFNEVSGGSAQTKIVHAPDNETLLTGLNEYTKYSIQALASTIKGHGIVSAPIFVITDEDSEFFFSCVCPVLTCFPVYFKNSTLMKFYFSFFLDTKCFQPSFFGKLCTYITSLFGIVLDAMT